MKYKEGDVVYLEGKIERVDEGDELYKYRVMFRDGSEDWFDEEGIVGKTYTQGLADAWEVARRIAIEDVLGGIPCEELRKIFGTPSTVEIFFNNSYESAAKKIEAYEKEKEIKVGDVVVQRDTQKKFLVVTEEDDNSVYEFGVIDLETLMLDRICNDTKIFKKTGKHIDIESLLKQIGE